jgi:uncharacterized repeat protein (TIGR02543 family)
MKKIVLSLFALCCFAMSASALKVYINPGHGSWGANCRPMATINYAAGDTLGFFESNTNLWKAFMLESKLLGAGYSVKMSRRASGGSGTNEFNKALSTICTEAENYGADYYISIHSNAGPEGELGGANGKFANYPVILWRGYTSKPGVTNSDKMAKACVQRLYEAFWTNPGKPNGGGGPEPTTYYSPSNPRIIGDLDFYNTSSTYGYLGALKHDIPGYLSEGYFHTYSPARHRALSPEWCRQEGIRYFRGIQDYYGKAGEKVGYIMGYVRSKTEKYSHKYYIPYTGSNDEYLPLNGAKIVLRNEANEVIKTDCYNYVKRKLTNQDYYTTDHNYNGVFVFENLAPGKYTLYVHKAGYKDLVQQVTVTADKTIYPQIFMEKGSPSTEPNVSPADPDITWELNGGSVPGGHVPTNDELWNTFKPYYNTFYGLNRSDQPITAVSTFAAAKMCEIMTDEKSEYKWLGNYIADVAAAAGYILTNDPNATNMERDWRWHVHAFFNCSNGDLAVKTANFSTAGKPEAWGLAYQIATGTSATLPYKVDATYTLPTPVKDGYVFVGWYDNPEGTGTALTSIPAGWKGTLYAIWREADPADVTWVLNGGNVGTTKLPEEITDAPYTIPTPTRTGYVFLGWYDNPNYTGEALTILPVGWKGTLYAKWREAKVTWVLNGGKVVKEISGADAVKVPTQEELWASYKEAAGITSLGTLEEIISKGAGQPHNDANAPCACRVICGKLAAANVQAAFGKAEWKWLQTYIMSVQTSLTDDLTTAAWRYAIAAFFLQSIHDGWPVSENFAQTGKPEAWGPAYQAAHAGTSTGTTIVEVELPSKIEGSAYTIPTPVKDGDEFIGWYNNAKGTGEALTVLPVGYDGTVYAIWKSTLTSVEDIVRPTLDVNAPMYDIMGRQVDKTYRGIIIQNGNKYLIR